MEIRRLLPQGQSGYDLNEESGFFTVVKAEESINLITNPSFENSVSTGGYSAVNGATITKSSDYARRGFFSAKVVCSGSGLGLQCLVTPITVGSKYTFSADVLAPKNSRYRIQITSTTTNARKYYTGTGNWQRVYITFVSWNASTYMQLISNGTFTMYTDGWQVENKDHSTTYFDGDNIGYVVNQVAYKWDGIRNESTSRRISDTKSGGREYKLSDLGFLMTAYTGLGVPDVENVASDMWAGGSFYQRTVERNRTITIVGSIFGNNNWELAKVRKDLMSAIYDRGVTLDQPMLLRFYKTRDGVETGEVIDIPCLYQSGLNLANDNLYQENIALSFIQYNPYLYYDTPQIVIPNRITMVDAGYGVLLRKSRYGEITVLHQGNSGTALPTVSIKNLKENNTIALFGNTINLGGVSNTIGFSLCVGGQITALGTGVTLGGGYVTDVAVYPGQRYGKIAIVGSFTSVGGVANTAHIAVYTEAGVWTSVKSAFTGTIINGCVFTDDGKLVVTGAFTSIGGVSCNRIAIYDFVTATWDNFGTGLDNTGNGLVKSPNGSIYVYGDFLNANGVATGKMCQVDPVGLTLPVMAGQHITHANSLIADAIFHSDGYLYIVGDEISLTTAASDENFYKWNGSTWSIANPAGGTGRDISTIRKYRNNLMYDFHWMRLHLGYGKTFYFPEIQDSIRSGAGIQPGNFTFDFNDINDGVIWTTGQVNTDGIYELYDFPGYTVINNEYEDSSDVEFMLTGRIKLRYIEVQNTGSFVQFTGSNGLDIPPNVTVIMRFSGNKFSIKDIYGIDYTNKILSRSKSFTIKNGENYLRVAVSAQPEIDGVYPSVALSLIDGITADNSNNGTLYYKITHVGADYTVSIYKDSAATQLVATSSTYTTAYQIATFTQANGSGLTGKVRAALDVSGTVWAKSYGLIYMSYKRRAITL